MKPKTGAVLLCWAGLCAIATFYAAMIAGDTTTLVGKGLTPPAYIIVLSGGLDEDRLNAECKKQGDRPVLHGPNGVMDCHTLVDWLGGGASSVVRQAVTPLAVMLGLSTVVSAGCGVACMRKASQQS